MANQPPIYPASPENIPVDLVAPNARYKRHAWLAMLGLMVFMTFYVALMCSFGYIAVDMFQTLQTHRGSLDKIVILVSAALLTVFMAKSLFVVNRAATPDGVEVTIKEEPKLFEFLYQLADEIGAPRPHRVFITADVNAAVFYDLSLLNLIFPSKKNLIIGLGLVNVLNLGELKAVLAHEFGHFSQKSMIVGRWVYVAQQIVNQMVSTRDWLDSIIRFIGRVDLRIAWIGWLLGLIVWCVRAMTDTLFSLVVMAERALSREMEFNADLVAVSVTGSDALVNALHKLQAADQAWQVTMDEVGRQAGKKKVLDDFFAAQTEVIAQMRRILDDADYGTVPPNARDNKAEHRVFEKQMALPPQMWATHPQNSDREDNAKQRYFEVDIDPRSAWLVFEQPEAIKAQVGNRMYISEKVKDFETKPSTEAVTERFDRLSYRPEFRGAYLSRSTMRNFESIDELLGDGEVAATAQASIASLYPKSLADELQAARDLNNERQMLLAIERGDLKPSGGVIRFRDEVIGKKDIAEVLNKLEVERKDNAQKLKFHDASCRRAHLQAAESIGQGWQEQLLGLSKLLHCTEHMSAKVSDELGLLINTWQVITADGTVGYFEKRRILRVSNHFQTVMREVSSVLKGITLPKSVADSLGIEDWQKQCPQFDLPSVDKSNWHEWCPAAVDYAQYFVNALDSIAGETLEQLIACEQMIAQSIKQGTAVEQATPAGDCPAQYPLLLPGSENVLQRKLDLWNRFQLAQGILPSTARFLVSVGVVGGTLVAGFIL